MKISAICSSVLLALCAFFGAIVANNSFSANSVHFDIITPHYCRWLVSIIIFVMFLSEYFRQIFFLSQIEHLFTLPNHTFYKFCIVTAAVPLSFGIAAMLLILRYSNDTPAVQYYVGGIKACAIPDGESYARLMPWIILYFVCNGVTQIIFLYMYYARFRQDASLNNKYVKTNIYVRTTIVILQCSLSTIATFVPSSGPKIAALFRVLFAFELMFVIFSLVTSDARVLNNNNISVNLIQGSEVRHIQTRKSFDIEQRFIADCTVLYCLLQQIPHINGNKYSGIYCKLIAEYAATHRVPCSGAGCTKQFGFIECTADYDCNYETISTVLDENDEVRYYLVFNDYSLSSSDRQSNDQTTDILCAECATKSIWQCGLCQVRVLSGGCKSILYGDCVVCKCVVCQKCAHLSVDTHEIKCKNCRADATKWDFDEHSFDSS